MSLRARARRIAEKVATAAWAHLGRKARRRKTGAGKRSILNRYKGHLGGYHAPAFRNYHRPTNLTATVPRKRRLPAVRVAA